MKHFPTVLKVARLVAEGDKERALNYLRLLADKLEVEGESVEADRLRRAIDLEPVALVHTPVGPTRPDPPPRPEEPITNRELILRLLTWRDDTA